MKQPTRSTLGRDPVPCGVEGNLLAGREPCQMGWYHHVASRTKTENMVLDVGAGSCKGLLPFEAKGCFAVGLETDERLRGSHNRLIICDVSEIGYKSIDVVTCFDVIEHVLDDLTFLRQLKRITRHAMYVTTPNFTRSNCQNPHHARELTIPQFLHYYRPDELWVGSPDGWHHRTMLASRLSNYSESITIACGKLQGETMEYDDVPENLSFAETTVDGHEWPHILGVWKRGAGITPLRDSTPVNNAASGPA